MATVKESSKVFGGQALAAGSYFIHSAFVGEDVLKVAGQPDRPYDTLEVRVFDANGQVMKATLRLNGCWRPRRGSDNNSYQASGSFFEGLLRACTGKSFSETRDYINQKLVGFEIGLSYKDYPSTSGGFGRVPVCNVLQNKAAQIPQLPAEQAPTVAPTAAPTAAPASDLPF